MRFPLRVMIAVPRPRTGMKALFPIRTWRLDTDLYEIKADLSGNMRSVAPVLATAKQCPVVPKIVDEGDD